MSDTNDKEIEDKITNILKSVREFTKLLDDKELNIMAKKLGKLKKIINTYKYIKKWFKRNEEE